MVTAKTWQNGLNTGLKTTLALLRVVVPVYIFIKVLEHTPAINWISEACNPLMQVVGLPGEAAIATAMGLFFNFYAAIGIIAALDLSVWQITTLGLMISCCHELVLETIIIKKTGVSVWPMVGVRLLTAVTGGIVLNLLGRIYG